MAVTDRQMDELPLNCFSSFIGFSFDFFSAFSSRSKCATARAEDEAPCGDLSVDAKKSRAEDEAPCGDLSVDAKKSSKADHLPCIPGGISQSDLDKTLAEGKIMTKWEPEKWTLIRNLAAAAAGDGTVELMESKERAGQRVAVKILPFHLIRSSPQDFHRYNPEAAEQPWTDISIVKYLNSIEFPYACELLGVFQGTSQANIVTSLATEGDLFSWIQKDRSAEGEEREAAMRPIVSQMCKGVRWLHDLGIAHRDLSAENVMLTDGGEDGPQVKIIDFGMATLARSARKELRGKRSYQAPEMHNSAKYDTFLVDCFAVGVIIYCMGVHYYPWEYTKPGKDRSTEYARSYGIEKFLEKKRMPVTKKAVADVFSQPFVELLCGLMDFDPELRYSLGEACFHPIPLEKSNSKAEWKLSPDALSEISTACSSLESLPPFPDEDDEMDYSEDDQSAKHLSLRNLRMSIWDCRWLLD